VEENIPRLIGHGAVARLGVLFALIDHPELPGSDSLEEVFRDFDEFVLDAFRE